MSHQFLIQTILVVVCCVMFNMTTWADTVQQLSQQAQTNTTRDPFKRARDVKPQVKQNRPSNVKQQPVAQSPTPTNIEQPVNLNGFSYELATTIDAFSVIAGGVLDPRSSDREKEPEGIFGAIDAIAALDTHSLALWSDGLFFFHSTLTFGKAPAVGDLNGVSDKYAGKDGFRIIQAWYEHKFTYSHSSFVIGLQDFNNEFYRTSYSKPFLNNGFRVAKPVLAHGKASTYPLTTLGLRYRSSLTPQSYVQFGVYDSGSSSDALDKVVDLGLDKKNGVFLISEIGLLKNLPYQPDYHKFAIGLWYLKDKELGYLVDIDESSEHYKYADEPRAGNGGAYMLAEASLGAKVGIFAKHGRARQTLSRYAEYYSAGVNLKNFIPERERDIMILGLVHTRHSDSFMKDNPDKFFTSETVWEFSYAAQIYPWLTIQPDFQYIQRPNMTSPLKQANTAVIGVRLQAKL